MAETSLAVSRPQLGAVVQLLKPITWFAPMWAFVCGLVSSGVAFGEISGSTLAAGILLTGPLVTGTSQAANDWYDRHVDSINEPYRPIPSGRVPGRWGLFIALAWTILSLAVSTLLGVWGVAGATVGLALAWLYSAPPVRLKQNGWLGNAAVGACYEGLPWFTGALVALQDLPDARIVMLAALYSVGAHGIMTLNDFKSVEGDRLLGIRSLPVQLGVSSAARLACWVMAVPQVAVALLLLSWGLAFHAGVIAILISGQIALMRRWLAKPRELAPWYNGTGVTLYVTGMMMSAVAVRSLIEGMP